MKGGGKEGEEYGSSPEEQKASAGEMWGNYSGWMRDLSESRDRDLGRIRAQAGAGGRGGLSDILITDREKKYKEDLASLESGEHGAQLKKYFEHQKQQALGNMEIGEYSGEGDTNPVWRTSAGEQVAMTPSSNPLVQEGRRLSQMISKTQRDAEEQGDMSGQFKNAIAGYESELAGINTQLDTQRQEWESMTMSDYYSNEFGEAEPEGQSAEDAAKERAKKGGSGRRVASGDTEGLLESTNWWG